MLKFIINLLLLMSCFISQVSLSQEFSGKHISIKYVTKKIDANKLKITILLEPHNNLILNLEAPWKLEFKKHSGVSFLESLEKKSNNKTIFLYNKKHLNLKISAYEIYVYVDDPKTLPIELSYKLDAFTCTDNKKMCYKETIMDALVLK